MYVVMYVSYSTYIYHTYVFDRTEEGGRDVGIVGIYVCMYVQYPLILVM